MESIVLSSVMSNVLETVTADLNGKILQHERLGYVTEGGVSLQVIKQKMGTFNSAQF